MRRHSWDRFEPAGTSGYLLSTVRPGITQSFRRPASPVSRARLISKDHKGINAPYREFSRKQGEFSQRCICAHALSLSGEERTPLYGATDGVSGVSGVCVTILCHACVCIQLLFLALPPSRARR